jgi:DNA-binding HxlR family transcriptional regulator
MVEFDYHQLNDLIHSRLRLAIITALIHYGESDFNFLKKSTGSSDGNLSVNTKKLVESGYLDSKKIFIDEKPVTKYTLTEKGKRDYEIYVTRLLRLLKKD